MQADTDVTALLRRLTGGEHEALDDLVPLVYEELRRLAHERLRGERSDHTLSTSDLVHEAYLRLVNIDQVEWRDRAHFVAVASQLMRRILVDYARRRSAEKRGGGRVKVQLDEALQHPESGAQVVEEVDEALTRLEQVSPRQTRIVEQRYFGGLTLEECAEVLGVSLSTVKRELRFAKAWLARELRTDVVG